MVDQFVLKREEDPITHFRQMPLTSYLQFWKILEIKPLQMIYVLIQVNKDFDWYLHAHVKQVKLPIEEYTQQALVPKKNQL